MQGLVLEGGGARGAYQIGAYKALVEEGFIFNGVSGTSIGALNGALIVQGDAIRAYELWENLHPSELFGIPLKSWSMLIDGDFQFSDIPELFKTLQSLVRSKGLDTQKVKALLKQIIIEDNLRKSPMDFGFVTYSLSDRKALEYYKEDIPQDEMVDYLMASANLPIFQVEKLGGKILIDGGVSDNLPVQLLIKKGYRELVIIRTFAIGVVRKFDKKGLKILFIEPSEDLGNILDFKPEKSKYLLQLGFFDVKRKLHQLKGQSYYIESRNDDNYYLDLLKSFCTDDLDKLAERMNLKGIPSYRLLFEHLMPLLSEALNLSKHASYEDIVLGVAEWMAKALHLARFKIYSVEDFLSSIKDHPKIHKTFQPAKILPSILIQNELGARVFKENIMQEIAWFIIHQGASE
ncbi:MAG TPA: patatin-like phospholipase family protein [Caldisericia bacterium]|nr:patatin-like phospholipase family protein [Caldisericia bacterium]